jgi:6-phosphogluconolactonase (cycloisomerase 2 family)
MSSISRIVLPALLAACASTVLVSAQATSSPTEIDGTVRGSTSPVAYVYVSSSPSSGKNQINGFAAAANGALAPIAGSPFSTPAFYMALNDSWLFATDGNNIDSFSITSNGALKQVDSLAVEKDGGLVNLYLDHTGTSLYAEYYTTNNDYLSYSIDNTTGQLTFVNDLAGGPSNNSAVSFVGNDEFAYSSSCYHFSPEIYGVQRASDGALSYLNSTPPFPTPPTGDFWCPWLAAADPTNHLAIAMQPLNGNWVTQGPYQLASYTVDGSGNLSTTNTYATMPKVAVGTVLGYRMSPNGKFLAVGGSSGLQIFHFNGAKPITKFTGLLTTTPNLYQMFWDNANHLYALSETAGKLYVFTVTSTGVTQAPGSPHTIATPISIIVLPKT